MTPIDPLMKICTLLSHDSFHTRDSTGFNKVGYITSESVVIIPFRKRYAAIPLRKFKGKTLDLCLMAISDERMRQIDLFFTGNILNPTLMRRAFNAICRGALEFFDDPIKLPKLKPIGPLERRKRWQLALETLEPGDLLQFADEKSIVSRLIAKVDRGCWSHTAGYLGEGRIIEAITSGVTERALDVYNKDSVRLGIYRVDGMNPQKAELGATYFRSKLGAPYGWNQLIRVGIEKLFLYTPGRKPVVPSPNDLIVWSDMIKLVAIV